MSEREKMVAAPKSKEPAAADEAIPRRVVKTLAEQGPSLPIGIDTGTELAKLIHHRVWKTRDERELGKLKKPKMNMSQYVGTVLAHLYDVVGPWVFNDEMKPDERRVRIASMYMADVFYMYVWLRMNVIGEKLKMNVVCPQQGCQHKFPFTGDLNTIEVYTASSAKELGSFYELRDPIEIRHKTVRTFRMGPARWGIVESFGADISNEALGKIATVRGSITGLDDDPADVMLVDDELDELSKRDFEGLLAHVNTDFYGPKMVIEGVCPRCETEFASMIDWRYDSFFSTSSQ